MLKMIVLDSRSRIKNPTRSVVRNPTPPKNLWLRNPGWTSVLKCSTCSAWSIGWTVLKHLDMSAFLNFYSHVFCCKQCQGFVSFSKCYFPQNHLSCCFHSFAETRHERNRSSELHGYTVVGDGDVRGCTSPHFTSSRKIGKTFWRI